MLICITFLLMLKLDYPGRKIKLMGGFVNRILDRKNNLKEGEIIPLHFDKAFKLMYANQEHLETLTVLLSKILKIDYNLLEGNITLLPLKATNKTVDEKTCERDVLVSVKTEDEYRIIIEVNVKPDFFQSILERNIYMHQTAGHILKENMKYTEIPRTVLVNFNTFFVNNEKKDIIEEFRYRDKYGYSLTEKDINYNINIEECYNLWYNDDYKGKFELYEEDLVLLGAAMMVDNEEDFSNIIRTVRMKPEIMELMEGLVREMNHDEKLVTEYKIWKNEEERINASRMDEAYKTGIEEGTKQTRKELVLDMYNDNVSLELISKYTKLNEEEVQKIIDSNK